MPPMVVSPERPASRAARRHPEQDMFQARMCLICRGLSKGPAGRPARFSGASGKSSRRCPPGPPSGGRLGRGAGRGPRRDRRAPRLGSKLVAPGRTRHGADRLALAYGAPGSPGSCPLPPRLGSGSRTGGLAQGAGWSRASAPTRRSRRRRAVARRPGAAPWAGAGPGRPGRQRRARRGRWAWRGRRWPRAASLRVRTAAGGAAASEPPIRSR
jgi:hypothetical protein